MISLDDNEVLTKTPGEDEIRRVVFESNEDSVVGPNGFTGEKEYYCMVYNIYERQH